MRTVKGKEKWEGVDGCGRKGREEEQGCFGDISGVIPTGFLTKIKGKEKRGFAVGGVHFNSIEVIEDRRR